MIKNPHPKMMTRQEFQQWVNALCDAHDQDGINALCGPMHARIKAAGFKDLTSYVQACAETWPTIQTPTQRRDTETMVQHWLRSKPADFASTTRLLHSFRRVDPQCKFVSDDDALTTLFSDGSTYHWNQ